MIDTIKILIALRFIKIIKPERFGGTNQIKQFEMTDIYGNASMSYTNPPTKDEKRQGYFPRIALAKNAFYINESLINLSIECSLPKILFNNNVEELKNHDICNVISKLQEKLLIMGVEVSNEAIRNAYVQRVDYSKNFIIKSNLQLFLHHFTKIPIDPKLGIIKTDYQRGGTGMKFYTNLYQVIIYNKLAEIEKSLKYSDSRSLTNDNYSQREIFNTLQERGLKIIRYEVSLKRKKITKLPIQNFNFESLFNADLSKQILQTHIEKLHSGIRSLNLYTSFSLTDRIKIAFPNIKSNRLASLKGYMQDIAENGYDFLRSECNMKSSQISRLKNDIKLINEVSLDDNEILNDIKSIESSLERFKALRLRKTGE